MSESAANGGVEKRNGQAAEADARALVRQAFKATLGTIARTGGHPYGSLVAVATEPDGTPLLLLSGLAEHTRNLAADPRASLLVDGTGRGAGALTGARVTLVGRIRQADSATARRRYLSRHPDAAGYIDFGDFGLYALTIEWAHLVAGFGRIVRLPGAALVTDLSGAETVVEAEEGVLAHMNEDHADAIASIAAAADLGITRTSESAGGSEDQWRMIGCDPFGFDLARGDDVRRIPFSQRINTLDALRRELAGMTQRARGSDRAG